MSKYLDDLNLSVSVPRVLNSPRQHLSQVNGMPLCIAVCRGQEKMEAKGAEKEFGRQSKAAEA